MWYFGPIACMHACKLAQVNGNGDLFGGCQPIFSDHSGWACNYCRYSRRLLVSRYIYIKYGCPRERGLSDPDQPNEVQGNQTTHTTYYFKSKVLISLGRDKGGRSKVYDTQIFTRKKVSIGFNLAHSSPSRHEEVARSKTPPLLSQASYCSNTIIIIVMRSES